MEEFAENRENSSPNNSKHSTKSISPRNQSYSGSIKPQDRSRSKNRHDRSRSRNYRSRSRSRNRRSRSRSYNRRSRSRSFKRRSRSRSYNRCKCSSRRSYTRSPSYHRRTRYYGTRENPNKSRVLGVFGLSCITGEHKLMDVFGQYGAIEHISIIHDAKTGKSRGFGFIYFTKIEYASQARSELNGSTLDGKRIRVDYSITKRAHTPTPGIYMGSRSPNDHRSRRLSRPRYSSRHRSPRYSSRSPRYYSVSRSRSRSRSRRSYR